MLHPLAISSIVLVASLALASALLAAAPRQSEPVAEAHRIWSLGLFFAPLGWALLESGALMPSNTLSVAAKTALAAGFWAYLLATARLAGWRSTLRWTITPVFVVLIASLWMRWQAPQVPMRTGLLSAICALFAAGVAAMAIRAALDRVPQAWTLATAFCASALALALRAFALLAPEGFAVRDWFDTTSMHSALLGLAIVAPAAATLAFLLAEGVQQPAATQADG